jgi:hypothetical protein
MYIQSLLGFGSALIAMPMLIAVLGPDEARPAFAILAQVAGLVFTYRYRHDWQWGDMWRALAAAVVGIPLGVLLADTVDQQSFMLILGLLLILYALYGLFGYKLPELGQRWSYLFGIVSGFSPQCLQCWWAATCHVLHQSGLDSPPLQRQYAGSILLHGLVRDCHAFHTRPHHFACFTE